MKICPHCQALYATQFTHCPKDGHALRPAAELSAGAVIRGKYEILEKIGAGGMGVVYKARHLRFNEVCALKLVSASLAQDPTFLQRFNTEALMMRRLEHPHALRVNDIDETEDGTPFIVMEYVEGDNLARLLGARSAAGGLEPERAARIAAQVSDALAAAHRLGIIHRDIKPSNILLARAPGGDHVKVFDFGIAKVKEGSPLGGGASLTQTGMLVGTPAYMSPEQCQGARSEQLDGRTDLYSLGIVLYEMLAGAVPFSAQTPVALLLAHVQERPRDPRRARPDLPQPLVDVVFHALEKDPAQRFQTAEEMRDALQAVLAEITDPNRTVAVMPQRAPGPGDRATMPPDTDETQHVVTPPGFRVPQPSTAAAPSASATDEKTSWTAPRSIVPRWVYASAGSLAMLALVVVVSYRMGVLGPGARQDSVSAPAESTVAQGPGAAAAVPPSKPAPAPARSTQAEVRQAAPSVETTEIILRPETSIPSQPAAAPPRAEPPPENAAPAKTPAFRPAQPAATKPAGEAPSAAAPGPSTEEAQLAALRTHFANGRRALDQVRALRAEIARAPAAERPSLETRLGAVRQAAIRHFESARQSLPPQDPNRHVVLGNLAQAYELAGRNADAAAAYEEAARLKPENGTYFLGWSVALARLGRNREAGEACERILRGDAVSASTCWLNIGVVHYNAGRGPEAVGPLRRATEVQPSNAQAWYVLGASLVSSMDFRRADGSVYLVLAEGTDDAYRRYLQLEPGGRFAGEARAALQALAAAQEGIETRIGRPTLRGGPQTYPRAGKDLPEARPVAQPAPAYPVLARHARAEGEVQVLAVIGTDGSVLDVEALSGPPLLYTAALEAVRKWRYQPVLQNNKPAEASTVVTVRFSLQR
jgi:serine/threonine-protein kinase